VVSFSRVGTLAEPRSVCRVAALHPETTGWHLLVNSGAPSQTAPSSLPCRHHQTLNAAQSFSSFPSIEQMQLSEIACNATNH
jgi:hypothetical protein